MLYPDPAVAVIEIALALPYADWTGTEPLRETRELQHLAGVVEASRDAGKPSADGAWVETREP